MVHKYLPPYSGDDRDDTFELLERSQTGRAIMDVMYVKGWRGKAYLAWFGTSSIYVLGFPTLLSATAGYLEPSTAGFNMDDDTFLTPDSPALKSCYGVNDRALIGLQNETVVQGPPVYVHVEANTSCFALLFKLQDMNRKKSALRAPWSCLKAWVSPPWREADTYGPS